MKNKKFEEACALVERAARHLGKDCQIIFIEDGVEIAPLSWPGSSTGENLFEALQDAAQS